MRKKKCFCGFCEDFTFGNKILHYLSLDAARGWLFSTKQLRLTCWSLVVKFSVGIHRCSFPLMFDIQKMSHSILSSFLTVFLLFHDLKPGEIFCSNTSVFKTNGTWLLRKTKTFTDLGVSLVSKYFLVTLYKNKIMRWYLVHFDLYFKVSKTCSVISAINTNQEMYQASVRWAFHFYLKCFIKDVQFLKCMNSLKELHIKK